MKVEVARAEEKDQGVISNLLQLYLYDFSELDGNHVTSKGRFQYPHLSVYWEDANRHPFLIKGDETLAGFALVKKGSEIAGDEWAMDVAEFFILRSHRRKGVGRAAFQQIARMFQEPWVVRVLDVYVDALEI